MENTSELRIVNERIGWIGFANLFNANNASWWHTKKWIIQIAFWLLFVNGMLASMIWSLPAEKVSDAFTCLKSILTMKAVQQNLLASCFMNFLAMYMMALPVAAIIAGQDSIIGERQAGTAAWVLSKPVSRPAFILSKLAASTMGILITGVVIQNVVVYLQLSLRIGSPWPIGGFLGVMGMEFLNIFFYLTLTYMLSAIFSNRGIVLGISLAAALIGPAMLNSVPVIKDITPWSFFIPNVEVIPAGLNLIMGQPLPSFIPVISTALFCLVFIAVTIWRFQHEEF